MNKHHREVSIEILVGLFMFVVLIALFLFTVVLSRDKFLEKKHPYEFVFTEIGGLREGDNVYLRGMSVGRVKQTALENGRVRVHVTLDVPIQLRQDYRIDIVDSSMLGGKVLKIYEGAASAPLLGADKTIVGTPPVDMIHELGVAVSGLKGLISSAERGEGTLGKLLGDDAMYQNLTELTEDLKAIVARVEAGEGSLGKLLTEDQLYTDVAATMANARAVSDRLAAGEGTLGKLMAKDAELYDDLAATMANARSISERLAAGEGALGKLMTSDDQLYADLAATMAHAREISKSIADGEGTLGRLVRDAKLYDEATLLVEDVRAAVDDLREASPITSFGSVIFGAF